MKTKGIVVLSALALSGVAMAGHKDGHNQGQGPKSSVDVENVCDLLVPGEDDVDVLTLRVTTTITDTSDDNNVEPAVVASKRVEGLQFVRRDAPPKKKDWLTVGAVDYSPGSVVDINLCQGEPLSDDATSLNASVQVIVDGRSFNSRCDNPFLPGDDIDGDGTDDVDQSRIDLDDYDPRPGCP